MTERNAARDGPRSEPKLSSRNKQKCMFHGRFVNVQVYPFASRQLFALFESWVRTIVILLVVFSLILIDN